MAVSKEYLRSLVPDNLPDGRDVLREGMRAGAGIEAGRSRLVRESRFANYALLCMDCRDRGEVYWATNVGLSTIEEEKEGIAELHRWAKENGIKYHSTLAIPSTLTAIPRELRDYSSKNTSYVPETLADRAALEDIEGMEVMQNDQSLGVPNAWETAMHNVMAGSSSAGSISQIIWNHPGCDDHVKYVMETLKAIGVIASKRDEGLSVSGYADDSFPSYCADVVAYVGFAMLEHYIVNDLCKARYTISYGGLISDVRTRSALLKAFRDLFTKPDGKPPVLFVQANTTRYWDHDLEANYGMAAQEMLMALLAERRYRTGAVILPVPITEKVHVPTIEAIKGMLGACARLEENIEQWEGLVDFTGIDAMAETLKTEGTKMFRNILSTLKEAGLDTGDPLHMLLFIKNFNPGLFEEAFHPSVRETGKLKVNFPTDMGKLTQGMIDEGCARIERAGLTRALKGRKILLASTDAHVYGLRYVKTLLAFAGAEMVDAGVDASVPYILDIADEEDARIVGVSTHNGQALGIARQLVEEAGKREAEYRFFMGGVLNTILPGHTEPSDVTNMINGMGIAAENNIVEGIHALMR